METRTTINRPGGNGVPNPGMPGMPAMPPMPGMPGIPGMPGAPLQNTVVEAPPVVSPEQLVAEIVALRELVRNQKAAIEELIAAPYIYGLVLQIAKPASFKVAEDQQTPPAMGEWVRIIPGSRFASQSMAAGEIDALNDDGGVHVTFVDGTDNIYAPADLERLEYDHAHAVVLVEGKIFEVLIGKDLMVYPGQTLQINATTNAIIAVATNWETPGQIGTFEKDLGGGQCQVVAGPTSGTVYMGWQLLQQPPKTGDQVVIVGGMLAYKNLGPKNTALNVGVDAGITWDQIGGLDNAKQLVRDILELPLQQPQLYAHYGMKPPKGVLLMGPPGCGKTLIGKAVSHAVREIYGGNAVDTDFILINGPEILNMYVGNSEQNIRRPFELAKQHYAEHGRPAVIFWDEADAVLARRGTRSTSDMELTLVPTFLSEMDGVEDSHAIVILSTNRPDTLDSAVVREGRVDYKIHVGRPNQEEAKQIFAIHLAGKPLGRNIELQELIDLGVNELYSAQYGLYSIHRKDVEEPLLFTMENIASGSLIASICQHAALLALRKDLELEREGTGIGYVQMQQAVLESFESNKKMEHVEALQEYCHDFKDEVASIQRLTTATS